VAGSARAMAAAGAIGLLALGGFAGCDSTQSKNERAELRATRELKGRKPLTLGRVSPDVRAARVSVVRGKRSGAIVVELRSSARTPLTDVPIRVGVRTRGGRRVPLNAGRNQGWFQTHVPAIAAGGTTTWVFTRPRELPPGRPFARVGVPGSPAISSASTLPRIEAAPVPAGSRRAARALVENGSDVPQYGLQVYALVSRHGRYVAAGKAELAHLGTRKRTTARVPLIGSASGAPARVHAIPVMFR
jgi:hypothetical protein